MSMFAGAAALATQAGASTGTAVAAGSIAELALGVASYNELQEPSPGHVSVNRLQDVAGLATERVTDARPAKKARGFRVPNEIVIHNVKVSRDQMEQLDALVSDGSDRSKRIKTQSTKPSLLSTSDFIDNLLMDSPHDVATPRGPR